MTLEEAELLKLTRETWNAFVKLPELHPSDKNEFQFHIHALQNIILAREGLRKLKEVLE